MATTDLEKVVLNSGVGKAATKDRKCLENTQKALREIAFGQKPVLTRARKSIMGFGLRQGIPIGCKVTLRKKKAWDFLFNLINLNLPLITNFQGIPLHKFDEQRRYYFEKGKKLEKVCSRNYNFGIEDLNIFPNVPYDLTFRNQGLQVTLVFKSPHRTENIYFLSCLGFPFVKKVHF
jgi:large subunit ribosomal protein L5